MYIYINQLYRIPQWQTITTKFNRLRLTSTQYKFQFQTLSFNSSVINLTSSYLSIRFVLCDKLLNNWQSIYVFLVFMLYKWFIWKWKEMEDIAKTYDERKQWMLCINSHTITINHVEFKAIDENSRIMLTKSS